MEFKGAVQGVAEDVLLALKNYDKLVNEAQTTYKQAMELAKIDSKVVTDWCGLNHKTISVYDYIISKACDDSWCYFAKGYYCSIEYNHIFRKDMYLLLKDDKYGVNHNDDIKSLIEHNPLNFYLNPSQAAWVNKWKSKV